MPADARPHARETLHHAAYQRRMKGLSAVRRTEQSTRGHIFWSPTTRQWLLTYSKGPNAVIEFYSDCPCGT